MGFVSVGVLAGTPAEADGFVGLKGSDVPSGLVRTAGMTVCVVARFDSAQYTDCRRVAISYPSASSGGLGGPDLELSI